MKAGAFFGELKRRNVLRAGALYATGAWLLVQVVTQVLPLFDVPAWPLRWVVIACAIGFPLWIAFAWFYEFTPSGLKRESEIAPGDSIAHSTGRKLDFWIIGILAIAVVLLVTNQFVLRRDATSVANAANTQAVMNTLAEAPEKSVAVLPLANESGDPKQQYFSDGLSEELISDLIQINGLKVIGKYSSFKFRDSTDTPAQIGATLGVANLIQGSVRQQGDRIRVTVNMIRTRDGTGVWSHTYDEPLKDVFAIQTQIGNAVAAALKIKLLGQTLGVDDKPPSENVEAYRLMLQGRALNRRSTENDTRQGIALLKQALKLDPDYAYAWGNLSNAWLNLGWMYLTGDARQQAYAQARIAADKQAILAPDAASTNISQGSLLSSLDNDPKGALTRYRRAYALAPNDGTAMSFLANGLAGVGQLQQAVRLYRKAIASDPLRMDLYASLAEILQSQGRLNDAEQTVHKALAFHLDSAWLYQIQGTIDLSRGQFNAAKQAVRKALALQPHYAALYVNLASIDMARGQLSAAEHALHEAQAMQPGAPGQYANQAAINILRGDAGTAYLDAQKETDPVLGPWARAAAKQIGSDRRQADSAMQEYMASNSKAQPYFVADLYALRKQPDNLFEWLQRARRQHDINLIPNLLNDPFVLPYQHDPRFAALCKQLGLPLPGRVLPDDSVAASSSSSAH